MKLKKCIRCQRYFSHKEMNVCSRCVTEDDWKLLSIEERKLILITRRFEGGYKQPTLKEINRVLESYELKTSVEEIKEFVRDRNLSISLEHLGAECRLCGAQIESGSMCFECAIKNIKV